MIIVLFLALGMHLSLTCMAQEMPKIRTDVEEFGRIINQVDEQGRQIQAITQKAESLILKLRKSEDHEAAQKGNQTAEDERKKREDDEALTALTTLEIPRAARRAEELTWQKLTVLLALLAGGVLSTWYFKIETSHVLPRLVKEIADEGSKMFIYYFVLAHTFSHN